MPPIQICQVDLATVVPVRLRELAPALTGEDIVSTTDLMPDSVHYAAFRDGRLAGVISAARRPLPVAPHIPAWELHGLAVISGHRGQGIGRQLVKAVADHAADHAIRPIWLYATDRLARFYTAQGFFATRHTRVHAGGARVRLFLDPAAMSSLDPDALARLPMPRTLPGRPDAPTHHSHP